MTAHTLPLPAAAILTMGLAFATACASESSAEAECRKQGFVPYSVGFMECMDPEKAEQWQRARQAWERMGDASR